MKPADRVALMTQRLAEKFAPTQLNVLDDSDQHKGHAGSAGGAGHYTVEIAAEYFSGKTRVAAHREIYAVLNDLIPHEVHALRIKVL